MWFACGVITELYVPDELLTKPIAFGGGVRIERIPEWVRDKDALEFESWSTIHSIKGANAAFCVDYEATGTDSPDPEWEGTSSRSIQNAVDDRIVLAQLCIWLIVSSGLSAGPILHFSVIEEADTKRISGALEKIRVFAEDRSAVPTLEQLFDAAELHSKLLLLGRDGNLWVAIRMLIIAVTGRLWEIRYISLWIMLEALFGPEDGREMTYRLAQRIAFFLGDSPEQRKNLFQKTKRLYGVRSRVVHGLRLSNVTEADSVQHMKDTEMVVKEVMRKILNNPESGRIFDGKGREMYLDDLSFE